MVRQYAKQRVVEHLERSNEDIGLVVEAYFHALTSMFPRKRYQVGNDSIFFYIPLSTLPTRWQDWIFRLIKLIVGAPKPKVLQKK
ncbi:Protein DHS-2 c [Aphelenchoides avenae]|nr:Protein DHS-2 c [Aphelenchus avenae]